jgi:hypothetical protein
MKGWLALSLKKSADISFLGSEVSVPFADMADGCAGVLMVFKTKDQAVEYLGDGGTIVQVEWNDEV